MTNPARTPSQPASRAPRQPTSRATGRAATEQPARGSTRDPGALEYESWMQELRAHAGQGSAPARSAAAARSPA